MADHQLRIELMANHDGNRPAEQHSGTGLSEPQRMPLPTMPDEELHDLAYGKRQGNIEPNPSPDIQDIGNAPAEFNGNLFQIAAFTVPAPPAEAAEDRDVIQAMPAHISPSPPPGLPATPEQNANVSPSQPPELKICDPRPVPPFVAQVESYENEEYYHGHLPVQDASELLVQPGDFLLRVTDDLSKSAKIFLSVQWNSTVHHVPIQECGGNGFCVEPATPFTSICQLVDYYTTSPIEFNHEQITLTNPILRQPWELKHSQVKLLKKLGEGAFGEVHLGLFAATARFRIYVAVKLLKGGSQNKKQLEEMMAEARMMRDLRHPNVVRFYGYAIDHEPLLIAMEHVQEGALDAYLRKKGAAIAVEVRMNMCCDAASAIEYLHAIPIMHRDISARNCLCSGKSLKLSDFGLSKKGVRYQMNSSERTPIRWTAPEVFASGVYTPKADVWAFGILVWEIFCNAQEEPYRGWDGEKVRAEVRRGSRLQLPNSAPPKAREVFAQTMIGSPDTRPAILVVANELRIAVGRATTPVVGNAPEKPLASPVAPRATNQRKPVMPRKAGSFPQVVPLLKASSRKPRLSRAPRTCPAVPRRSSFKPQRSLPPQQRQRSSSSSHSSKSPRPTSREPMRGEKKHKSSGSKHSLSSHSSSNDTEKMRKEKRNGSKKSSKSGSGQK